MRALPFILAFGLAGCSAGPAGPPDAGPCLIVDPPLLDFGEVDSFSAAFPAPAPKFANVRLTNNTSAQLVLSTLITPPFFSAHPLSAELIQPGKTESHAIGFLPRGAQLHFGEYELKDPGGCSANVSLRGLGRGSLEVSPRILDFGFVPVGERKTIELLFANSRRVPMAIEELRFSSSSGNAPVTFEPARLVVPASGSASVLLSAATSEVTFFSGTFSGSTDVGSFHLNVRGFGGNPPVAELADTLHVPSAWFYAGCQYRSATGLLRRCPFTDAVLPLGNTGLPLSRVQLALISPVPLAVFRADGGAADDEVELLNLPPGIPPGQTADLRLRITPSSPGPKTYHLTFFTNEPTGSEHTVTLTTTGVDAPSCSISVDTGPRFTFTRTPTGVLSGTIVFSNVGTTPCLLGDLSVSGAPGFAVVILAGLVEQVEIPPGMSHAVTLEGLGSSPDAGSPSFEYRLFNSDAGIQKIVLLAP